MQQQIAELKRRGHVLHPPASEESLRRLQQVLGVELPEPLRQLYTDHGGMPTDHGHMPLLEGPRLAMRLLSPDEAADEILKLRTDETCQMIYGRRQPDETAILWADPDGGINFAGMFVTGPLTGRVHILAYDDPGPEPLWSSVASFYDALLDLGEDEGWQELFSRSDYCPCRRAVPARNPDDDELAEHYFELYRDDPNGMDAQTWALRALALSVQAHAQLVLPLLDSDNMQVQEWAAMTLGGWRWDDAVPHLAGLARHGTHNGRIAAVCALRDMRTDQSRQVIAELRQELPSSWRHILGWESAG